MGAFVLRWLARLLMILLAPPILILAAIYFAAKSGKPSAVVEAGRWFAHQWRDP